MSRKVLISLYLYLAFVMSNLIPTSSMKLGGYLPEVMISLIYISAAYAVVNSISNPCGDFIPWHKLKETTNPKVLTLLIIDRVLPFKFHILIFFFFRKLLFRLHNHCKNISLFSWRYHGSHFMAWCSCWLCKAKNKHNSLWKYETIQDKPLSKYETITEDTDAGQPTGWSTDVVEMLIAIANFISIIRGISTSCKPLLKLGRGWRIGPNYITVFYVNVIIHPCPNHVAGLVNLC